MTPAQLSEAKGVYDLWVKATAHHKAIMDHIKANVDTPVGSLGVNVYLRPLRSGAPSDPAYAIMGEPGRAALVAMANCLSQKVAEHVAALAALGVTFD